MDCKNTVLSSQNKLKEAKDIFLEIKLLVNEINALQKDSNNLCIQTKSTPDETIELRVTSSANGGGYLNDSSQIDIEKISKHDPIYNFSAACYANVINATDRTENYNITTIQKNWDTTNVSKHNPVCSVSVASNGCYDGCSNVSHDGDIKKTYASKALKSLEAFGLKPEKQFDDASSGNGNGYSNAKVMNVDVPNSYGFNEKRFERVQNEAVSQNLVNYCYYLSGEDDVHDTFDCIMDLPIGGDIDVGVEESMSVQTQQDHAFHKKSEFTSNVDICLTNEPDIMDSVGLDWMDSVNTDVTTELIRTSPNVSSEVDCEADFIDSETVEVKRYRGCDNSKMFVPTSDAGPKEYYCIYCSLCVQKLERHLRKHHKNEKEVEEYLAFKPRSPERRKLILRIQKQGDFKWNNSEEINGGKYAVRRRPNKKMQKKPWDLVPCPVCLGTFTKSYLRRHSNKECMKNPIKFERGIQQLGRVVEGRIHSDASQDLVDLFARFIENENIRSIRFDWVVICYGNDLCLNHSPDYQQGYICGKLRAAGKVLRESKLISTEITDMSSMFHVKNCNTIVKAIRSMGKFDHKTKRFGSPGTASTTVTLVNAIGELLVIEAMKLDDPVQERNVERFLKVFKKDVRTKINKLVAVTKEENRRHKIDNIPTTADVNKLSKYLDSERESCYAQLVQKYSYAVWLKLSQLTMATILVYNRRRAGEMQNLLIEDFEKREIVANQSDMLLDSVPEEAKQKIKSRVMVRNKLGKRAVPMLLKHSWDNCLELLIYHRGNAGIPERNKYLFSLPTKMGRIKTSNACTIMRSFSLSCGAENPSSLRGTNLRKHIASFSATKNLSDNDISNLADFMGHAEEVHRAFYRINPLMNQVSKMSSLFDSAQGNDSSYDGSDDESGDGSDFSGDEYESDDQSEAVTRPKPNAKRKITKKNISSGANKKRKTNMPTKKKEKLTVIPKRSTEAPKKNVPPTKMKKKRNGPKTTCGNQKRSAKTSEMKKKRKI